jgi:hypothetical protein
MYKIDFMNEKKDKLFFYEKYEGNSTKGKLLEYAYIEPEEPDIHYKDEYGDIKTWPKKRLAEFLLNLYNKIVKDLFEKRIDLKSKSSQPRFGLRIGGKEINLIHFFVVNLGLLKTLDFLKINYQFGEKKAPGAFLHLKVDDPNIKYLSIFSKSIHDEYMINGLKDGAKLVFPASKSKLNSPDLYDPWFALKGKAFANMLRRYRRNFIDITTAKILKMYDMPSDIMDLFGKYIPEYLLNAKVSNYSDLSTQRIRMAEAISHSAYSMLQQAIGKVKNIKDSGDAGDIKLNLHPYEIVKKLGASGMLQYTKTTNPLEELMLSTKITKTGVGNPMAQQVVLETRDLNPSYYGVVAPVSTNEYGNVGSNQTLTNKVVIKDRFGSIVPKEFTDDVNGFDLLSASESLQPFYEYDDTTRRVMGNQQFGQFVQLENGDEPLVQTGFEAVVPQLVSDRFAVKAKKVGQVSKITKDEIIIKNQDGTQTKYNIREGRSRTKRGIYIPMKYIIHAKEGQKVKPGDVLASTSSLKTGKLTAGKNLVVAEMSYRGMNFEDGWAISEKIQDKYKNKIQEKITIIIPIGSKVKEFNIIENQETSPGDILISFTNKTEFNLDAFDAKDDNIDDMNSDNIMAGLEYSGEFTNYRSSGGKIVDVVIKLNDKNIDTEVLTQWKKLTKDIEKQQQECQLVRHDHKEYVDCISGIENTEILKVGGHVVNGNEFDGAVIEVYLEKENKIAHGSKFTLAATGGKGTVQYIIPKDKAPIAVDTKMEIEFIPTPLSIIGRKNISILLLMYSGKVIYFMNKKIKELAAAGKIKEMRDLIIEIFSYLDESKDKFLINQTMSFFDSKSTNEILKYISNSDPLNRPAFPLLVPPHKNKITIKNIEMAANALGIPLNEKVRVPEENNMVTEEAVPVGIMPIIYLEHFPKAMSGARGSLSAKRQFTTGQGRSGTRQGAGAIKLGFYDLFAMSFKEPGLMIKELHGIHSDNADGKKKFTREVLKTGKMPTVRDIKIDSVGAKTKQLVEVFFRGAMLDPEF